MSAPLISIASGKGGTGKTTVSVNLASVSSGPVILLDCDVEAPNAHLFLRPSWNKRVKVAVPVPVVAPERCTGCGICRDACRFNAVALLTGTPTFFPELCHSCGNCIRSCPENALEGVPREIGTLRRGRAGGISFADGILNVGEARSGPVIERVRAESSASNLTIVDAPPGTSCPAVAAVRKSTFALLVTEPTPFGLHDLRLAAEMVEALGIRAGVVINRWGIGTDEVASYCRDRDLPILARIPFDREIARAYAGGVILARIFPVYRSLFRELLDRLMEESPR